MKERDGNNGNSTGSSIGPFELDVYKRQSDWIADLARQSFLGEYPIVPVYNGIDTDLFRPAAPEENKVTRAKLGIAQDTRMVLGVANVWDKRKRLSSFIELASAMENENVIIVVVGITEKQKQALDFLEQSLAQDEVRQDVDLLLICLLYTSRCV